MFVKYTLQVYFIICKITIYSVLTVFITIKPIIILIISFSLVYSRATTTTPPRQGEMSPPNATSPLTPFEVQQRMNLFSLYNNNQPQIEPQKEPINLSEPTPAIKREPECRESPPPPKRVYKEEEEPPKSLSPASPVHTPTTHIKINSRGKLVYKVHKFIKDIIYGSDYYYLLPILPILIRVVNPILFGIVRCFTKHTFNISYVYSKISSIIRCINKNKFYPLSLLWEV